ncbi:response regulator [Parasediminibacterium sp. JCM 36343]|uniref:response regulator n=1 Tax=Parasediminibacterium sp. JCM 36343 TaxID=3374279 RepID=UPI00397838C8
MIKTVLSIDDDKVVQFLHRDIIESELFCEQLLEAYNGEEALDFYNKFQSNGEPIANLPEVILLDLNMPGMNGWEFFEAFEKRYPQYIEKTKIFILSSSINPADISKAKTEKNIVAFLEKPLDVDKLTNIRVSWAKC